MERPHHHCQQTDIHREALNLQQQVHRLIDLARRLETDSRHHGALTTLSTYREEIQHLIAGLDDLTSLYHRTRQAP